jgi:hypothetical protein
VKLTSGATDAQVGTTATASPDGNSHAALLDVTRTQHEQRMFPVVLGQSVAVGVRRIHILPTPLSSYTACASEPAAVERLAQHPLLVELATRMKTRIVKRPEPALSTCDTNATTPVSGVAVIAAGPKAAAQIEWLLRNGAGEVMILPSLATPPQRVLIHWADDQARRSTLAVAASLLRHVAAEAVYVGILPDGSGESRPFGVRTLLDARSEAQAVHGLEMRTELRFGAAAEELQRQLNEGLDQMLILGVSDPAQLGERFGPLFSSTTTYPMVVVYRPARDNE